MSVKCRNRISLFWAIMRVLGKGSYLCVIECVEGVIFLGGGSKLIYFWEKDNAVSIIGVCERKNVFAFCFIVFIISVSLLLVCQSFWFVI